MKLALAILLGTALVSWDNLSVRVPLMDQQLDGAGLFSTDVPNKLRALSFEHWLKRGHDR